MIFRTQPDSVIIQRANHDWKSQGVLDIVSVLASPFFIFLIFKEFSTFCELDICEIVSVISGIAWVHE